MSSKSIREKIGMSRESLAIAKRQFYSLKNEKTILLAIFVQLFVALFSSFLVVGFVSIFDPGAIGQEQSIALGLSGNATEGLESSIEANSPQIVIVEYEDEESMREGFRQGEVASGINIDEKDNRRLVATVILPEEGFESTVSSIATQDILEEYELERQNDLIRISETEVPLNVKSAGSTPFVGFINTVLIPLLIFLPAFISGAIVIDTIIEDEEIGITKILKSTPVSDGEILLGKMMIPILLGPIQMSTWILLLLANGINIELSPVIISMGAGLTLLSVGFGTIAVNAVGRRGPAQVLYSVLTVFSISVMTVLPELPTTTIARLSLGSYDSMTLIIANGYLLVGSIIFLLGYVLLRKEY